MIASRAPGKLIITGEHAILYDSPALAVAVERYAYLSFSPKTHSGLSTFLHGIAQQGANYPINRLGQLKNKLDKRFQRFMNGELPVQNILQRPDDLLAYSLASLAKKFLPFHGNLNTYSELFLGSGMGSSAAFIAGALLIGQNLLGKNLSTEELFKQVRFCERLQHGRGSALDAAAVSFGGVQELKNNQLNQLDSQILSPKNWAFLLHGIPQSSTGECVAQVRTNFKSDKILWEDFSANNQEFIDNLQAGKNPRENLQNTQKFLTKIGVVPENAQRFITELQKKTSCAVKISGAGSIRGDFAGMILLYHEDKEALARAKALYPQYFFDNLKIAQHGAELIPATAIPQQN